MSGLLREEQKCPISMIYPERLDWAWPISPCAPVIRQALLDRFIPASKRDLPVNRDYFLNLIAFSLSHSIIEKIRVILAYPSLSDGQITSLIEVWEDERREFNELWSKEYATIARLWVNLIYDWALIVNIFMSPEDDFHVITKALEDDKKGGDRKYTKGDVALKPIKEKFEPMVMVSFANTVLRGTGAELYLSTTLEATSAFWFVLSEKLSTFTFVNMTDAVIQACERAVELDASNNRAWLKAATFLRHKGVNNFHPRPYMKKAVAFFDYIWPRLTEKPSDENKIGRKEWENRKFHADWYSLPYAQAILWCAEADTENILPLYLNHDAEARDKLSFDRAHRWIWVLFDAGHGREAYALLMEKLQTVLGTGNSRDIFDWQTSAAVLTIMLGEKPQAELHLMAARQIANGLVDMAENEDLINRLPDLAFVAIAAGDEELLSKVETGVANAKKADENQQGAPGTVFSAALLVALVRDEPVFLFDMENVAKLLDILSILDILYALSGFIPDRSRDLAATAKMLLDPEMSDLAEVTGVPPYFRFRFHSFIHGEGAVFAGLPEEVPLFLGETDPIYQFELPQTQELQEPEQQGLEDICNRVNEPMDVTEATKGTELPAATLQALNALQKLLAGLPQVSVTSGESPAPKKRGRGRPRKNPV